MRPIRPLLASLLSGAALSLLAQVPQAISYQAVVRSPVDGAPMANASGTARFVLHDDTPSGPSVYSEEHAFTANDQGLFTLSIGTGGSTTGTFDPTHWGTVVFLEVLLDVGSTGTFVSMGAQQLLSVPFALRAGKSSNVPDGTEVGQVMHWDGTVWVADSGLYVASKRFGIGDQQPDAPLSIQGRDALKTYFQNGDVPSQNDFSFHVTDTTGFSIEQGTSSTSASRLFIQSSTGHVGIGTTDPSAVLSIVGRNVLKSYFQNGDVPSQNDFSFHLTDTTGFSIEQGVPSSSTSRLYIQPNTGNVGVNELTPDAQLHVSRPTSDPAATLSLQAGTGILEIGPASQNLVLDHRGLQARQGNGDPAGLGPAASTLHLQPLGGDLLIHGGASSGTDRLFVIKDDGRVGIGTLDPTAALHVSRTTASPEGSTGLVVENVGSALDLLDDRYLIGLRVAAGSGGGAGGSRKSIGLYVSSVSGQTEANNDLAAVINGNTVIGDLHPARPAVGMNGTHVLVIQNGAPPTAPIGSSTGTTDDGVQLYSANSGGGSVVHVMNGNGDVIVLQRQAGLTPDAGPVPSGTLDPAVEALIENMRTRINELETRLKTLGLLTP